MYKVNVRKKFENIEKNIIKNSLLTKKNGFIFILCLMLLGLYAPIGKPLWIDEFLHFALGSYDSLREASKIVHKTIIEINHGQTGVYMLADYILLKMFGASAWALRAPSLLSGVFLLIASLAFLRAKGVGTAGQIALLIAYSGQINLMSYMGEARPYMPLAAAVVGALAYYAYPIDKRAFISVKLLGWVSVLLGTLMHPYFCLYWYALLVFSYVNWLKENKRPIKIKDFTTFSNLRLVVVGTIIALAVGSVSWLRGRTISFEFDPYQWITQGLWVEFTTFSHFAFIPNARIYVAISLLTMVFYIAGPKQIKRIIEPIFTPAILMILALSISMLLGYVSYTQKYWILHRQWIASEALVPISLTWGIALLIQKISVKYPWAKQYLWMIVIGYLIHAVMPIVQPKLSSQISSLKSSRIVNVDRTAAEEQSINIPKGNEEWVRLANQNVLHGKDVWEVFQLFYGKVK